MWTGELNTLVPVENFLSELDTKLLCFQEITYQDFKAWLPRFAPI